MPATVLVQSLPSAHLPPPRLLFVTKDVAHDLLHFQPPAPSSSACPVAALNGPRTDVATTETDQTNRTGVVSAAGRALKVQGVQLRVRIARARSHSMFIACDSDLGFRTPTIAHSRFLRRHHALREPITAAFNKPSPGADTDSVFLLLPCLSLLSQSLPEPARSAETQPAGYCPGSGDDLAGQGLLRTSGKAP